MISVAAASLATGWTRAASRRPDGTSDNAHERHKVAAMVHLVLVATAAALVGNTAPGAAWAQAELDTAMPAHVSAATNDLAQLRTGNPADQDRRIFLFHRTSGGLRHKVWTGTNATGAWSAWTWRNQPEVGGDAPLSSSLVSLGGMYVEPSTGVWTARFTAAYNFRLFSPGGGVSVGLPMWRQTPGLYSFVHLAPPTNAAGLDFIPSTGITWLDGSTQRQNLFGVAIQLDRDRHVVGHSLRELWHDGSTWRYADHDRPQGRFYLRVGPSSAIWTNALGYGNGYVFATADTADLWALWYDTRSCASWCWFPLGQPDGGIADMRAPVALQYHVDGRRRIAVFVTAKAEDGYHLYSRYTDGSDWRPWTDHGAPPNLVRGKGFELSNGVVWRDGSTLRINLFGTTDPVDRLSSGLPTHTGGHLVDFFWDGSVWSWGSLTVLPETRDWGPAGVHPVRLRVSGAAVVDAGPWQRISVFGEDELGTVWERAWSGTWNWQRH